MTADELLWMPGLTLEVIEAELRFEGDDVVIDRALSSIREHRDELVKALSPIEGADDWDEPTIIEISRRPLPDGEERIYSTDDGRRRMRITRGGRAVEWSK